MASIPDYVYDGVLDADGTIHLDHPPEVRPGPVRVTVQPRSESATREMHIVEDPCGGEYIPICDLPLPGPFKRIFPKKVEMLLPDRHDIDEENTDANS